MEYWIRLGKLFLTNLLVWCVLGSILGFLLRMPIFFLALGAVAGILYWMAASFVSDKFAPELYDAKLLEHRTAPRLYELVEALSRDAGIPSPRVLYAPLTAPNAFAVGRGPDSASIIVANGMVNSLSYGEARAVLALMISRIKSGDAGICGVASALAGFPLVGLPLAGSGETMVGSNDPIQAGAALLMRFRIACLMPFSILILRTACTPGSIARNDMEAMRLGGDAAEWALAMGKIAGALPKNWWEAAVYNPATALLFAVPPLPPNDPVSSPTPGWLRNIHYFPFHSPTANDRFKTAARPLVSKS